LLSPYLLYVAIKDLFEKLTLIHNCGDG